MLDNGDKPKRFAKAALVLRSWTVGLTRPASIVCVALLVLHWTVKDRWPLIATVYYAAPPAVLACFTVVVAFLWRIRGKQFVAIAFSGAALPLLFGLAGGKTFQRAEADGTEFRVLFWNVAGKVRHAERIADEIANYDPEIIGLAEAGSSRPANLRRWKKAFPSYQVTDLYGGLIILSKRKLEHIASRRTGENGAFRHVRARTATTIVDIILADIESNPLRSRQTPIEDFTALTKAAGDTPVILMGDFNTPAGSIHFRELRKEFANAFELYGIGFAPTWPLPTPVMQIDHAWVRGLQVSRCEHGWPSVSDHRPVVVHIEQIAVE